MRIIGLILTTNQATQEVSYKESLNVLDMLEKEEKKDEWKDL